MDVGKARISIEHAQERLGQANVALKVALGFLEPEPDVVYHNIRKAGQPQKAKFGSNSWKHKRARSVWDMVVWGNRRDVFIGCGDYQYNSGGHVYRMDTSHQFHYDAELWEEAVQRFWPYQLSVWNAGIDPRGTHCAVHRRMEDGWQTFPLKKSGYHLIGMAIVADEVFVIWRKASDVRLYHSFNLVDWTSIENRPDGMRELVDYDGSLIVFCSVAESNPIYKNSSQGWVKICPEAFPGETATWKFARKCFNFNGEVVYGCIAGPTITRSNRKLYALNPNAHTTRIVWESEHWYVSDFFVDNDELYIMVIMPLDGTYITARQFNAQVLKTNDLEFWQLCADCVFPAVPFSCIKRDEKIYIGVGCRGLEIGGDPKAVSGVDEDSGTIYELVV